MPPLHVAGPTFFRATQPMPTPANPGSWRATAHLDEQDPGQVGMVSFAAGRGREHRSQSTGRRREAALDLVDRLITLLSSLIEFISYFTGSRTRVTTLAVVRDHATFSASTSNLRSRTFDVGVVDAQLAMLESH